MISALLPFARPNAGWLLLLVVLAIGGAYYTGQHIGARDAHAAAEAQRTAEKAAALQQLVDTMRAMSARAAEQATEDFGLATRHAAAGKPDGGVRSAAAAEVGSARGPLRESR